MKLQLGECTFSFSVPQKPQTLILRTDSLAALPMPLNWGPGLWSLPARQGTAQTFRSKVRGLG